MVGLDDFGDLFQPKQFHDSMMLCSKSSLFKGLCLKSGISNTAHVASLLVPLQSGLQDILEDMTLEAGSISNLHNLSISASVAACWVWGS